MENEAYKWLQEWLENGGCWRYESNPMTIGLNPDFIGGRGVVGFREDVKQLLADAEAGRKLREGDNG